LKIRGEKRETIDPSLLCRAPRWRRENGYVQES
jgi:hypothetical protein